MRIKRQNTLIEISELGLKIEIKADLLFQALISTNTLILLEKMLENKLSELKSHFEEIHAIVELEDKKITSVYFDSLKENRNAYIYEYACLSRDLYSLLGDTFDKFYEDNSDVMETISSIYKYSILYGFKPSEVINVE